MSVAAFSAISAQENATASQRYEKMQPQDRSVPPPPVTTFPATFPGGNKTFADKTVLLIHRENLPASVKTYETQVSLKIDAEGNVVNISVLGNNPEIDRAIKAAAYRVTSNIRWNPGRNKAGVHVVDIVRIPLRIK